MNESEAYNQYIDMIRLIAHRAYTKNQLYGVDDLIQIGSISIINCCRKFDPSRNTKMSTLVYLSARRDIIGYVMRTESKRKETELDEKIQKELIEKSIEKFDEYLPDMNESEKKIINLIVDGYNREDISKKIKETSFKTKKKIDSLLKRIENSNEKKNIISN